MSRKIYRGGRGRGAPPSNDIRIPNEELLPRELGKADAKIYYKPAISHKDYRYSHATDHYGGFDHTFLCILNQTEACNMAAAKVAYCANKLHDPDDYYPKRFLTLDNYYKENMNKYFEDSGCYAFLDFIIRAERKMMGHEYNNYETFLLILKAIFQENFFSKDDRRDFFNYVDQTRVTFHSNLFNGVRYDTKRASSEAKKYKVDTERFLSSLSTKTLYDRLQRVEALKLEVEALEQKELEKKVII